MASPLVLDPKTSALVVIDVQEKLARSMPPERLQALERSSRILLGAARELGAAVLYTEQYPKGLGPTVPTLRTLLRDEEVVEKVHFSCVAEGCLVPNPVWGRAQFVVAGTEAHVCVLQSVLGLVAEGKDVFVVADAVGSRHPTDRDLGIARMRDAGAQVVSREMVAFEWLARADTDVFREISRKHIR